MPRYETLTGRRPRSKRAPAVAFAAVTLGSLLVLASPASAETTLEVTTPADGRYLPGSPAPLIVTIRADRAVSGTLVATFDGFRAGSQRVEVPGGSAKEVVLIANLPPWATSGSVSFDGDNSEDDSSTRVALTSAGSDELVAVLPELAARDLPATAELVPEVGVARLYPLDPALLDSGSEVLSPFTQLVATATDLDSLDPDRLAAIENWVGANGGVLVVDEEPGSSLPLNLLDSGGGAAPVVPLGVGEVRFTSEQAAGGNYDGLLQPTPSRAPDDFPWGNWGQAPSTMQLARDAGVRVPAIGSILIVLLVYTVAAGPLLWLGLRRSRREPLLWLVGPGLALITTLGVYGIGRTLREDASTAHATLLVDLPTLRVVSTQVLVTSPNGGSEGVTLPDGWRPTQLLSDQWFFEGPLGGSRSQADATLRGSDLVADLPPGGVGVVAAETTQPATEPSWGFDLEPDGDSLAGTITNLSGHDLEEVFVASGQGFTHIDHIGAGDSAEVTLADVDVPPITNDRFMERLFNSDPWSANDGPVNAGLLTEWLSRRPLLRAPGYLIAVGWTREESGPLLTTRGTPVESGRTAFLSVARVASGEGNEPASIEFLRGWNSTVLADQPGPNQCADFAVTVRMTPPDSLSGDDPVLAISTRTVAAFDVWDGAAWQPAGMSAATTQDLVVGLPASALTDGSLYLRLQMGCDFWGAAQPFPELRAAAAGEDVLQLGALDQTAADDGEAVSTDA